MATMAFTPLIPRNFYEVAKFIATLLENAVEERLAAKSRSKHPVWVYFARLDRTNAICLLCSCPVKSACSTNLARHIANHHPSTALEMRKAWLAGRDRAPGGVVSAGVGVSTVPSPSAAIAAISPDCEEEEEKMNCDSTDPSYPLLVNPYSSAAMMGNPLGQPLLTVGLSDITGGCSWLPYQDLRTLDGTTAYETELTLGCQDLSSAPKYETVKYDYTEIQTPEKAFDTEPRLYHKAQEEIKPEEDAEKDEKSQNGDSTPVKRGRPTENPCWNYFFRLDDQNVRCKLCSKVVKSACATNMTKHLERHHQHDYQHLIVQIRQYRSSKGPLLSTSSDLAHLLPSNYVKTEYPDIYSTSPVDASELAVYPQTSYERALQDSGIWNRQPWNQWQTGQPLETATIDARTSGVIIHGNSQSWASTSTSSSSSGGGGPEKPYMKRNRKTEHPVWEYFKRTQDGNAQCAICSGVVKSPCSSNFMRHLMRHHSVEYNNVYMKWIQKRGPAGGPVMPTVTGK